MKEYDIDKLVDIVRRAIELANNNAVLREDKEAARALGQEAYDLAGLGGMRIVYNSIQSAWMAGQIQTKDGPEGFHPSEFQAAWDGVGVWRW